MKGWNNGFIQTIKIMLSALINNCPKEHIYSSFKRSGMSRSSKSPGLVRFSVNSPPVLTLLSDPAWLALLISILFGYKSGKESTMALFKDVQRFVNGIRGLNITLKNQINRRVKWLVENKENREITSIIE